MLWWFGQTTLIAGALAILAILASRWKRLGAEARYALWLVVLIKLAIPPVVAWPWSVPDRWPSRVEAPPVVLPSPPPVVVEVSPPPLVSNPAPIPIEPPVAEAFPSLRVEVDPPLALNVPPSKDEAIGESRSVPEPPISENVDARPIAQAVKVSPPIADPKPAPWNLRSMIGNPESWILGLWLFGSLVVVLRRSIKIIRFQRSVWKAAPAPAWLVEETRAIGRQIGVKAPSVVMTSKVLTPLLWCLGRPLLILPEALVGRLEADRWPGILAHELAHLARRDHWVVRLELLVEAFWWWNPLFWHVRRKLHEEAELACDARVVRTLPERRFAYAEALVDVCEHLARISIPSPALGVGGPGASRSLEGRLLMILRDPIPRRPSRMGALVAMLLMALALPAWTLGQQEPGEIKPKAEGPASPVAPTSKPDEPKPSVPQPLPPGVKPSTEAAEATGETIAEAQIAVRNALKKLSFRYIVASRERSTSQAHGMGEPTSGPVEAAAIDTSIKTRVSVEVADVSLMMTQQTFKSRVDLFGARLDPLPTSSDGPKGLRWDRRFVVKDGSITSLSTKWDRPGAVPFRWLSRDQNEKVMGDSLACWLAGDGYTAVNPDRGLDPLNPRPENVLNYSYGSTLFLGGGFTRSEMAGVDLIDGQEAVRVAWIGNRPGLRGICWYAPKLGFALVRLDATHDPIRQFKIGRLAWRKQASEFVKVGDGNHWMPGKVVYEETVANPSGTGEPVYRNELRISIEDYKLDPENAPADNGRPKLAIQGLDDKTGQFTAIPPEIPAGLLDRLKRAVAENPFKLPVEPKVEAFEAVIVDPRIGRNDPPKVMTLPAPAQKDAAKADPGIIAQPKAGFEDPIPILKPTTDDPIPVKDPGDRAQIDPILKSTPVDQSEVRRMSARRNGKAAELQKAEAKKLIAQAVVDRNQALINKNPNYVSREDKIKAEGELAFAEAEVASKKADLGEAEIVLANAKQPGLPSLPVPRSSEPSAVLASSTLPELRDAVELLEVQLRGKKADFDSAGSRADSERRKIDVQEYEIRLKQARRRIEAEEARLKREIERVKDRVSWSEEMLKKGYVSSATALADRATYDDLMTRLDPNFVPVPTATDKPKPKLDGEALPVLELEFTGEKTRFSGQTNEYKIRLRNTGKGHATDVDVTVSLPEQGGKLLALPKSAKFDVQNRRLYWSIPRVDPGQNIDLAIAYQVSKPGLYRATVDLDSDEVTGPKMVFETEVTGVIELDLQISQKERIIDVGSKTHYDIVIKNSGTKEATKLSLVGTLSKNLKILKRFGIDQGEFKFKPETGEFLWPPIDRLGAGQSITLSMEVQATSSGPAGCHLYLGHSELAPDAAMIEDVITTTVTKPDEPKK
jgi:beta-lactamase regulating signal transducer with metallopeptidase domain